MKRGKRFLLLTASFVAGALAFLLIWAVTGHDTLHAVGYWIWLYASPEDLLNNIRITSIHLLFVTAMPILVGLVCAGWVWLWLTRRNKR